MNRSARRKAAAQQRRKARRDAKARRQREQRERYRQAIQRAADLFVEKVLGSESRLLNHIHLTPIDEPKHGDVREIGGVRYRFVSDVAPSALVPNYVVRPQRFPTDDES